MNINAETSRKFITTKPVPISIADRQKLLEKANGRFLIETSDIGLKPEFVSKFLNTAEIQQRNECEAIIGKGWDTFLDVGRALTNIRHGRLYRDRYQTFDEYCRRKWEFSKTHANRLIEAAAVAAVLTPIGVKVKNESQLRPLVALTPEKIPVAWKKARELAGTGEVTAKLVQLAAKEFKVPASDTKGIPPKKKNSEAKTTSVNLTLKLIEKAEKAALAKDFPIVLNALLEIRKHILK